MTHDAELAAWLRLSLSPGLGAAALRALLGRFGLPTQVLAAPRSELAAFVPRSWLDALHSDSVERAVTKALGWVSAPGHAVVTLSDGAYPKRLLETSDPPAVLYVRGRLELLNRPAIAVVGSRNATPQGRRNAEMFARSLSSAGLTIVSGLALGIDAAAHEGGLAGAGSTIAVLGTGIDVIYPPRHRELAELVARDGLLLSEFALESPPLSGNFPRRNRLISGLSQGCVVVEAAAQSGSLITARLAADQGREVFAIPGSIHSPLSKGCHALIKSGAKLVESFEDILAELGSGRPPSSPRSGTSSAVESGNVQTEPLLTCMGHDPIDVNTLCARAGLPADRVSSELLRLELAGRVAALPGGRYQRLH